MHFRRIAPIFAAILIDVFAMMSPARAGVVVDPTGDTFNTGTIDITSITTVILAGSVQFTFNFAGAIAPPSAFAPNSVIGFVDLDTDQNAATGGTAPWGGPLVGGNNWINFFIPPNPGTPTIPGPLIGLGDEFYVDLGSELFHPGLLDIVSTATNSSTGVTAATYGATSITFAVPFPLIGNDDGLLNFGALVGDFNAPTDRVLNGSLPASTAAAPEPSSLGLIAIGLAGFAALRRRKLI